MQISTLVLISNLAVIASVWLLIAHEFSKAAESPAQASSLAPPSDNRYSVLQTTNPDVQQLQANVAKLDTELQTLHTYFKTTRKELGRMKCEKAAAGGVGDSGGFCLWGIKEKFTGVGGNDFLDISLSIAMEEFLAGKVVYDFGCGMGRYGGFWLRGEGTPASYPPQWKNDWKDAGNTKKIKSWAGFDGSEGVEEATDNFVKFMDLSVPAYMPPVEWVVGLEVGEHVPAEFQTTLLDNFARHNTEGMIISWAVRGQGGHHHVNNLDNHEVVALVEKLGYTYDKTQSEYLKSKATYGWFKNTVMVFRKNK